MNWLKNPQAQTESYFCYSDYSDFVYYIEYDPNSATFKSCFSLFNSILGISNGWSSVLAAQNHWFQVEQEILNVKNGMRSK